MDCHEMFFLDFAHHDRAKNAEDLLQLQGDDAGHHQVEDALHDGHQRRRDYNVVQGSDDRPNDGGAGQSDNKLSDLMSKFNKIVLRHLYQKARPFYNLKHDQTFWLCWHK